MFSNQKLTDRYFVGRGEEKKKNRYNKKAWSKNATTEVDTDQNARTWIFLVTLARQYPFQRYNIIIIGI
jgi:hypothetical protein